VTFALGGGAFAQASAPMRRRRLADQADPPVSPFNPGGAIDVLNRVIAEKLGQRLGQQVIVDAVPGANTIVGADVVAKAAPDGYTFMITTMSTHVNNTVLFRKLPFDRSGTSTPITQVSLGSVLLTAPGTAGYSDLKGFVAWAKQQNRPISYGSWGIGSSANVYGEILAKDHGVSLTHVPYKGEQPAITDVIGGSLDVTFASPVGAKPQVQSGKLKAIGMTGPGRSSAMPDVPTFAEQGYRGFELPIWVAPTRRRHAQADRRSPAEGDRRGDPPARRAAQADRAGADAARQHARRSSPPRSPGTRRVDRVHQGLRPSRIGPALPDQLPCSTERHRYGLAPATTTRS
jgi:tripartite-type tricarboxylate transporter receptor subunit TctC